MAINLRRIEGNWDSGYALDKHVVSSFYLGDNEFGHPTFDTTRTPVGEAVYKLKYKRDWPQAQRLARAIVKYVVPLLEDIDLIVPMPASTPRDRQPVTEVASALGKILGIKVYHNLLLKNANATSNLSVKNINNKIEKQTVLAGRFYIRDEIDGKEKRSALLLDDLFDSGASMEAACATLRSYSKIDKIFAVALTWK